MNEINKSPSITVVIPCLNEQDNISKVVENVIYSFEKYKIPGEVLVINDGSKDKTAEVAEALARKDQRIRVIHHETPWGIGGSFLHGVKEAKMQCVTMIPGDNEVNPEGGLMYLSLMDKVDIIVPFFCNVEVRSRVRRVISSIYRFIINVSFGMNLTYTNGAVIYNTAVVRLVKARSKGFLYQAELLINLIRMGYLYAEVPQFLGVRVGGRTKALTLKSLIDVSMTYLKIYIDVHIRRTTGLVNVSLLPESATYRRSQTKV